MASSTAFEGPEKQPLPAAPGVPPTSAAPPSQPASQPNPSNSADDSPQEPEADELDVFAWLVDRTPAWLVSMVFHLLVMIVMAMMVYANMPERPIELNAQTVYAEKLGDQLLLDAPGLPDVKTTAEDVMITPENLPPVESPLAAPGKSPDLRPNASVAVSDVQAPQIGMAFKGRESGSAMKQGLLGKYGGDGTTEAAVQRGLAWLARNQRSNGSWSLAGPYSSGAPSSLDNDVAATAMALLGFQGDGNTPGGGKYKSNVGRGWNWLLKQQDRQGSFYHHGGYNDRFYTQGQCGIAICELYGMTRDSRYREPAQLAIDYCVRTQGVEGGWRYQPNADSDVSVTGWVVMALQSGRMAGLKVPYDTLGRVSRFLDMAARDNGSRYCYLPTDPEPRLAMTAEALLMREYLGWKRNDPRLVAGMEWITSPGNLIDYRNNHNVYYWYYAAQAAHHIEGECWSRWNKVMRQAVPAQQVQVGKEAGSWDPSRPTPDQYAGMGGRLYVTCLSIYMLEVYYRHLPLYSSVYAYESAPKMEKPKEIKEPSADEKAEKPKIDGVE